MSVSEYVWISADWSGLESRLVAYFSGDETLTRMHEEELTGGYKVHSHTAAILYGIDPGDAKSHIINLQGRDRPAYDGGKRLRHAWQYGMKEREMARTFWITMKKAEEVNEKLSNMHPGIPRWWARLGDEVFGVARYVCVRCNRNQRAGGVCTRCSEGPSKFSPRVEFAGWEVEPARVHYTPCGRRRLYLGRRTDGMNALISQDPQSTGTSIWYRSTGRLHGRDIDGTGWLVPHGTLVFSGSYGELVTFDAPISMSTGTYDSGLLRTRSDCAEDVIQWLAWTMEQSWPELGGLRVPVEIKRGENWADKTRDNVRGLEEIAYRPLSAERPRSDGRFFVPV